MGEHGPLSPDDKERLREERLRLVWSKEACFVIFRNRELLFRLSCPSLPRLRLLLRAILALELPFLAGPTLIDVFSKGVVEMDTLFPLFRTSSTTSVWTSPCTGSPLTWVMRSP